jgi:GNAT superfamily N-acetyltransferase
VSVRKLAQELRGPTKPRAADVPALNRLFSDSFTDRYRRDGLVGVRVPQLNTVIWRYAIRDAGKGAMLWFDERDELVAFNIAHHSGTEGWMGPLAVRVDHQGLGVGKTIVTTAVQWLKGAGVTTLGLETMPRTVENIGFYGRLGFTPRHLTVTMIADVNRRTPDVGYACLSEASGQERKILVERCRERLDQTAAGYDFTRELELTAQLRIGDTTVISDDGEIAGFALWHSAPLAQSRSADELRVLKLFGDSVETLEKLVMALERCAARSRIPRVAIRCQTAFGDAFEALIRLGYKVRWTDLRMTLMGYSEPLTLNGEILFSNWEI